MMLRTYPRCRLTAFFIAALLCGFSCIGNKNAHDASNMQAETKITAVDDEAVKEKTTSMATTAKQESAWTQIMFIS